MAVSLRSRGRSLKHDREHPVRERSQDVPHQTDEFIFQGGEPSAFADRTESHPIIPDRLLFQNSFKLADSPHRSGDR